MISPARLKELCRPFWENAGSRQMIAKLWRRDHTLWKPSPRDISNRLGWIELPQSMRSALSVLADFIEEVRARRFKDVVLLGMGGSSLAAEVMRRIFPPRDGFPTMHVLDSTVPSWVLRVQRAIDPARTLFLVSSKSGTTIEVMAFYKYFRNIVEKVKGDHAGENFIVITDSGTPLEALASSTRLWHAFINRSDVGGRYSALSFFGLVPAALMGIDVNELLARGREASRACGVASPIEENPGAWLGMVMGCLAQTGREKLTLIASPSMGPFGLWAEQLIAESTGKEGCGIVPVVDEPPAPVQAYGDDRLFVYLRLLNDANESTDRHADALEQAGFPVLKMEMRDLYDTGAEFFLWEFAVALAGACLDIHPFDQPNVAESKEITQRVLGEFADKRTLPALRDEGDFADLLGRAREGDYLALMAFTDDTPETAQAIADLRKALIEKRRLPTTFGFGPRFLHSTGQLHKGGANNGLFVQITAERDDDLPVPGERYTFGALATAQAIGDLEALKAHERRAIRIHVAKGQSVADRIRSLIEQV